MVNWVNESIFYHIYPLGFCGCEETMNDVEHHRLTKIIDWIPHLKSLHINALYLGPINASTSHGYDTRDYFTIDSRLGSNNDFKIVCDCLHNAGIRIVLDGVFNHVGRDFWAFKDLLEKKENSPYQNWFHNVRFNETNSFQDPFHYDTWEGYDELVKLNLSNPEVKEHLLSAISMWIDEYHIDGLRLDAADCMDQDFFHSLKCFCKEKKQDFWLMGEIIHGDYNRWANDSMLDSVTNYECFKGLWSSHNTKNYFEIGYSLNRQFGSGGIYKHLCLYNFVDNHDVNRLASTLNNQQDLFNVYTLLYTMPGCPSLYYGSEWGIKAIKHDGSDQDIRPCLELMKDNLLTQHIEKLGEVREQSLALQYGDYEQVILRNEQFIFKRSFNNQVIYIALNLSDEAYTLSLKSESLIDALSNKLYPSVEGNVNIQIQSKQSLILSKSYLEKSSPLIEPAIIQKGYYRHFKGNEYEVIDIATHSENLEPYVVYRKCYDDHSLWIRPLKMFQETIQINHQEIPRFTFIKKSE
ncbi:MAG: DUF1653 domain-containing protein [Erysipelotrichaceae bacterium]